MELLSLSKALATLGLPPLDGGAARFDASAVKRAFREHARTLHPDKNPSPDATSLFQTLVDARDVAYAILDNPGVLAGGGDGSAAPPAAPPVDVYDGNRCPCCETPVAPPPVRHPFFRCPECAAVLRHPNPKAGAYRVEVAEEDMVAAPEQFLRAFTGAIDLRRTALDAAHITAVWRCSECAAQDGSARGGDHTGTQCVCCRVKERRGMCMCGHKLADHRNRSGSRPMFACSHKTCGCRRFKYHVRIGGWCVRCSCKHKHTDHDPATGVCSKLIPGRKPCPCRAFEAAWVCNCGHQWNRHETAFVELPGGADGDAAARKDFMSREWVAGGVRPEIMKEAAAKRAKWAARGHAPRGASDAARAAGACRYASRARTHAARSAAARASLAPRRPHARAPNRLRLLHAQSLPPCRWALRLAQQREAILRGCRRRQPPIVAARSSRWRVRSSCKSTRGTRRAVWRASTRSCQTGRRKASRSASCSRGCVPSIVERPARLAAALSWARAKAWC